jgi:hypothetical protein
MPQRNNQTSFVATTIPFMTAVDPHQRVLRYSESAGIEPNATKTAIRPLSLPMQQNKKEYL